MIELFASRHPFLLAWSSFIAGVIAALPAAFACWHIFILPGLAEEMKVREQIAEGTQIIVTLAGTDKNCLDWREKNGGWSCIRR